MVFSTLQQSGLTYPQRYFLRSVSIYTLHRLKDDYPHRVLGQPTQHYTHAIYRDYDQPIGSLSPTGCVVMGDKSVGELLQ